MTTDAHIVECSEFWKYGRLYFVGYFSCIFLVFIWSAYSNLRNLHVQYLTWYINGHQLGCIMSQ